MIVFVHSIMRVVNMYFKQFFAVTTINSNRLKFASIRVIQAFFVCRRFIDSHIYAVWRVAFLRQLYVCIFIVCFNNLYII